MVSFFHYLEAWLAWLGFALTISRDCIRIGPNQYPHIYNVIRTASQRLGIDTPIVYVMHGRGQASFAEARRFNRRGFLIVTGAMMDEFSRRPESREFMMFIGTQLAHIRFGHLNYWFARNVIGVFSGPIYFAWRRRCCITADRVGLLCSGDVGAAQRSMLIDAVGSGLAPATNFRAIEDQREEARHNMLWRLVNMFSSEPTIADRLMQLQEFAGVIEDQVAKSHKADVGAIPISHTPLRVVPLLIIHGHDQGALNDLKILLYENFPHVLPRVMQVERHGALSLPEKFETVASDLMGAIALVTPDDLAAPARDLGQQAMRPRQNVALEIGWAWSHLGRRRVLILKRGDPELPSDLSGVDTETFDRTPKECLSSIMTFVRSVTYNSA